MLIEYKIPVVAQQVLDFWFGGDQTANYKTKWFPEGSSSLQANIDQEIYTRFYDLFKQAIAHELDEWKTTLMGNIALIVVLDQFSRHIFRHLQVPPGDEQRLFADRLALDIATSLHENQSLSLLSVSMAEYVFSLMPLRHSPSIDRLQCVLARLEDKENSQLKAEELLERFRKQTVRRLQHLQDRAKLEATDDILERHPFQADESDIMDHPLVRTTENFLRKHLMKKGDEGFQSNSIKKRKQKGSFNKKTHEIRPVHKGQSNDGAGADGGQGADDLEEIKEYNIVMISLSGGVDSMVLSKILALLKSSGRIPIDAIVAMHIDYANRPESGREAAYVQEWSNILGISCHVRTINEATRGVTERDAYEKITRGIRYGFYQDCRQKALHGEFTPIGKTVNVSGVIFGHHLGDVQENVISNVMRGSSPLDLSGMTEYSITNNVLVWRPLLQHVKQEIYDFAHKYGVPYFKDSTPSWSTRGKLRNQLIPLLVEVYGEGCLRNLSNLASESDQNLALVFQNLYSPFLRSVRRYPCGLIVNVLPFRAQPQCFWREILKLLMHSMGMSMVREKAVSNFVERLHRPTTTDSYILPGWLELRKGFHTFLTQEGDLLIIRDGILRSNLVVYNPATTRNQMLQSNGTGGSTSARSIGNHDNVNLTKFCVSASNVYLCIERSIDDGSIARVIDENLLHETNARDFDEAMEVSILLEGEIALGPWAVKICTTSISPDSTVPLALNKKEKKCKFVGELIANESHVPSLSYGVSWPVYSGSSVKFMLLKDAISAIESATHGSFSIMNNNIFLEEVSPLSLCLQALSIDLRAMDLRLRDGLPLLVPVAHDEETAQRMIALGIEEEFSMKRFVNFQIDYRYIGPANYAEHHMH